MNLLLLDSVGISSDGRVRLTGAHAAHAIDVLKVVAGQTVRVGIVNGSMGTGTVVSVGPQQVELECRFDGPPSRPPVDVLLALPRPKVLRRLWAQLAALGVGRILITNAERVERNYFDTHVLSESSYRPLLIEGLQQARDTWLPVVSIHRQFKILIEDHLDGLSPDTLRLVADPSHERAVFDVIPPAMSDRILLAIGPEGGWNDYETALLKAHRFVPIGMGPRTLRSDTACIALLALVHAALRLSTSSNPHILKS